jgi:pectate lyase
MVVLRHLVVVVVSIAILSFIPSACIAANKMNAIDQCWKPSPSWRRSRQQLASCSVGFAGKMTNNVGRDVVMYKVTDPSDDPVNPKQGTLRHGATMITGKVWITFERNMDIKLEKPLLISSYTAIDGRGVDVGIEGFGCFLVYKVH